MGKGAENSLSKAQKGFDRWGEPPTLRPLFPFAGRGVLSLDAKSRFTMPRFSYRKRRRFSSRKPPLDQAVIAQW
jgi:hypothetical protein